MYTYPSAAAPRTVRRWLLSKSRSCIAKKTIEMQRPFIWGFGYRFTNYNFRKTLYLLEQPLPEG